MVTLEMYDLIRESQEETLKKEDEELETLFGNLTDEQLEFLSNLKYKYFRLGCEITESIENFKK